MLDIIKIDSRKWRPPRPGFGSSQTANPEIWKRRDTRRCEGSKCKCLSVRNYLLLMLLYVSKSSAHFSTEVRCTPVITAGLPGEDRLRCCSHLSHYPWFVTGAMSICPKHGRAIPQRHRNEKWRLVTGSGRITFVIAGNTRWEHGGRGAEWVHTDRYTAD